MKNEKNVNTTKDHPSTTLFKNLASAKKSAENIVSNLVDNYDVYRKIEDNPGTVNDAQQAVNDSALKFYAPDKSSVTAAQKAYADAKNNPSPTFEIGRAHV